MISKTFVSPDLNNNFIRTVEAADSLIASTLKSKFDFFSPLKLIVVPVSFSHLIEIFCLMSYSMLLGRVKVLVRVVQVTIVSPIFCFPNLFR